MADGWQLTAEGRKIMSILQEMDGKEIDVGFIDGAKHKKSSKKESVPESVSVAEIAAWNEYGTVNIPARPFMHDAIEFNRSNIQNHLSKHVKSIMQTGSGSASEVLNSIGSYTQKLIQKEIKDGMWAPNAPATIRMKGSDKPLIDTSQMRQSVKYVIKESE